MKILVKIISIKETVSNKKALFIIFIIFFIIFIFNMGQALAASEVGYGEDPELIQYSPPLKGTGYATTGEKAPGYDEEDAAFYGNANNTGIVDTTKTGLERLSKALPGQTVHGNYKRNTNSCASCHMTHTAAGEKLLFRDSIFNTCAACHDGTMDAYNVFADPSALKEELEGAIKSDKSGKERRFFTIGGGTFAGPKDMGSSVHLSTGILTMTAAPGGNRSATSGSWRAEFNCASCHAPHGSYSSRLLHYNPNNIGMTPVEEGGLLKENINLVPATESDKAALNIPEDDFSKAYVAKEQGKLVTDPWLYDIDSVVIKENTGKVRTEDFEILYGRSYALLREGPTATFKVTLAPAIYAKFNFDSEGKVVDYGDVSKINDFCGACHTDYNKGRPQANGGVEEAELGAATGTFSKAYRHNMKGNGCLECHYAHGTTQDIQMDALYNVGLHKDINPSSALKRYVNMSVCWNCHVSEKAESFSNNFDFYINPKGGEYVRQNR